MSLINYINGIDDSVMITEGTISDLIRKTINTFGTASDAAYDWYQDAIQIMTKYDDNAQEFVDKHHSEILNKSVKGFSYTDYPYDPNAATAYLLILDGAIYEEVSRLNKTIDEQYNVMQFKSDGFDTRARQTYADQFKTTVSKTGEKQPGKVTSLLKGSVTINTSPSEYRRMFLREHCGESDLNGLVKLMTTTARGGSKKVIIKDFSASSPKTMLAYMSDGGLISSMRRNLKTRQTQYNETRKYLERLGTKKYVDELTGDRVSYEIAAASARFIRELMVVTKTLYQISITMRQETMDSFQKTLTQFLEYNPNSSVKESLLEEAYKYI